MRALSLLLVLWFAPPVLAQELLKDINPGPAGSSPSSIQIVNGVYLFRADDGVHGTELWRTDGTEEGTFLVKDIRPGAEGGVSLPVLWGCTFGDTLYFLANDGEHGLEWWKTDGTEAGTALAADVNPGPQSHVGAYSRACLDDAMYFHADVGADFNALWKLDPATNEATLVRDFPDNTATIPLKLYALGDLVLFGAHDNADLENGFFYMELWRSDGTAEGTEPVTELWPGESQFPGWVNQGTLTAGRLGDEVLFSARVYEEGEFVGQGLWKTDGTAGGTTLVVHPSEVGVPIQLYESDTVVHDGFLYFSSDYDAETGEDIWRTDGTTSGTELVVDFAPEEGGEALAGPLGGIGDSFYFGGHIGLSGESENRTIWRMDLGAGDPEPLGDFILSGYRSPALFIDAGFFFQADDGAHGMELWRSDGTPEGTSMVADLNPGPEGSDPSPYAYFATEQGGLFFAADDGARGQELWALGNVSVGSEADGAAAPAGLRLSPAYPNPFVDRATVTITTEAPQRVDLEVFDALGRRVAVLYSGVLESGRHHFDIAGVGLPTGVYFIRATGEESTRARMLTLIR